VNDDADDPICCCCDSVQQQNSPPTLPFSQESGAAGGKTSLGVLRRQCLLHLVLLMYRFAVEQQLKCCCLRLGAKVFEKGLRRRFVFDASFLAVIPAAAKNGCFGWK
jgi:hypothetical protein